MDDEKAKHPAAVELGLLGGKASAKVITEAKRAASRANGKLGGAGKHKKRRKAEIAAPNDPRVRPDWTRRCIVCDGTPIVPLTEMCGPCTFGEADTAGGNW